MEHTKECLAAAMIVFVENARDIDDESVIDFKLKLQGVNIVAEAYDYIEEWDLCRCKAVLVRRHGPAKGSSLYALMALEAYLTEDGALREWVKGQESAR